MVWILIRLLKERIVFKFKLILGNDHDSSFQDGLKNKATQSSGKDNGRVGAFDNLMKIWLETRLFIKALFYVTWRYAVFFVFISVPFVAYGSIFSFMTDFFSSPDVKQDISSNSQNIALLQASVSPNRVVSGGDISIVGGSSLLPENSGIGLSDKEHASDQISVYVVRSGDTLASIAKMFGVSTNTIIWANDIKNGKVSLGDQLAILPINGIEYVVKSGDTVQSVAKKFKGDVDEIASFNNISVGEKLSVGDTIIIPDGEMTPAGNPKKPTSSNSSSSTSLPQYSSYYMRPIVGGIRTQGIHGHNGVDLASSYGSQILAAADGQVIIAKNGGWNGGYGSYVVIKHGNGTQTLYGHLSGVNVSVGQSVTQGQVIGLMGSTGQSTGTHLHFEIRGARNPF